MRLCALCREHGLWGIMKTTILLASCVLLLSCALLVNCGRIRRDNYFTDKYDNIDIDEILRNDRLLEGYYRCIKTNVGCNAEGRELRKSIPEALKDECSRCTERQKEGAEKVMKFLYKNKPEYWKELEELYDPDGIYRQKYRDRYDTIKD